MGLVYRLLVDMVEFLIKLRVSLFDKLDGVMVGLGIS
jgi:hypothetical protein